MTNIVVDSDIIIDYLRTGEGQLPRLFTAQRDGKCELYLSAVTVLELFAGKSSKTVEEKLHELIEGFTVIPVGVDLAIAAGQIKRDNRVDSALADLIIGATSVSAGAKLATRNKKHFRGIPKIQFAV